MTKQQEEKTQDEQREERELRVRTGRSLVDVSREIVIDTMVLTTNLLHAIRNNLPLELETAQREEHRPREKAEETVRRWSSGWRGLLLALVMAAVILGGLSWLGSSLVGPMQGETQTEAAAVDEQVDEEGPEEPPIDPLLRARGLLELGDAEAVLSLLEPHIFAIDAPDERVEMIRLYVDALLADGRPAEARTAALRALQRHPGDHALIEAFHAAIEADPALGTAPVELRADEIDSVWATGRDPLTIRVNTATGQAATLLLDQSDAPRAWRNEVASYRFCLILACPFQMPPVRAVTVERGELEAMLGKPSTPFVWAPRPDLDDLSWRRVGEQKVVDAALVEHFDAGMDHVDDGAPWPIEHPALWRNWLSADLDPAYLDEPFEVAHAPVSELHDFDVEGLMNARFFDREREATTRDVARALAGVMVFDFLTNNWSRFSKNEAYFGARVRLREGRLISLDHGEAFRYRASKRVRGRFVWVTRMPRAMTTAIQHLDLERVAPILFPQTDDRDRARLAIVAEQQRAFVERLAELIEAHGAERVFGLE